MSEVKSASPKRSWFGRLLLVLLVLAALLLVVIHLLRHKEPKRSIAPQVISVAVAVSGTMPQLLNALGTVKPTATVTVVPQLSGYLSAVGYREGQDVTQGQFLAQIDPRQYEISKRQAKAQLAKDQSALAQARSDLARYAQLHAQKSIAAQTYIDQQFLVEQDEAAVKADKAVVAQSDLNLAYCRITAPIAGRVGLRLVDPGNYVSASAAPGMVVITTIKPTTVEFAVPQEALGDVLQRFHAGATLAVTAYNSDNSKQLGTGTLYAVDNQMAAGTGTVMLRASFPNEDEVLFPGAFVNIKLLVNTLQNAVLVPTVALQSGAPGDYVYLVHSNNTVSVHTVTLGPSDGKQTVILSGLEVGDKVATDGVDRLSDGTHIRVAAERPVEQANGTSLTGAAYVYQRRPAGSAAQASAAQSAD